MSIKYDEYDLLELFGAEPIAIVDQITGIFLYNQVKKNGLELFFKFSTYEDSCSITLYLNSAVVASVSLEDVISFVREEYSLRITLRNSDVQYLLHFRPSYCIEVVSHPKPEFPGSVSITSN